MYVCECVQMRASMCVCVYICICMCVIMCAHVYSCMNSSAKLRIYAFKFVRMYAYLCVCTCVCVSASVYVCVSDFCMHMCPFICTYICQFICMYVHICRHTQCLLDTLGKIQVWNQQSGENNGRGGVGQSGKLWIKVSFYLLTAATLHN